MLTKEQIEHYRKNGYLVVADVLDRGTVAELSRVSNDFIKKSANTIASDDVYDVGPGHSLESPRLRRLKHPHTHHPIYEKVVRCSAIVDIVEALVGPGVRFDHSKLNYNRAMLRGPSSGTRTGRFILTPMTTCWRSAYSSRM